MESNVYELLKSGRSAEDLVAEFTAHLNEAEKRLTAEREAAEAAHKATANKTERLTGLLENFMDFVQEFYPNLVQEKDREELRAAAPVILGLLDLASGTSKVTSKNEDVFTQFFKTFGI